MVNLKKAEEALWVAAALKTFNVYYNSCNNGSVKIENLYFRQADVLRLANEFCKDREIEQARISYHCQAMNPSATYKYFVKREDSYVRLVYNGEMNYVKEKPTGLDRSLVLDTIVGEKNIGDLIDFIDNEYTDLVKNNDRITNISKEDYLGILEFLKREGKNYYKNPDKIKDIEEKDEYISLKKEAQEEINKFKTIVDSFSRYGLYREKGKSLKWLDGTNKRVRNYFWAELKKDNFKDLPSSISIVAERCELENRARYKVIIDINDEKSTSYNYLRHFKFLDLVDIDKSDFICLDSKYDLIYDKSKIQEVIQNVKDRKEIKLQLGRVLYYEDAKEMSLEEIKSFFENTVRDLLKYYDKAVEDDSRVNRETLSKEVEMYVSEDESIYEYIDESPKNFILYGPPGTGKTYNVIDKALEIIDGDFYSEIKDSREKVLNRYKQLVESGQIEFCTFHQSYGYEEFVEGLKSDGDGNFIPEDGVLKRIALRASYDGLKKELREEGSNGEEPTYEEKKERVIKHINSEKAFRNNKKYVLIIDEINRGNISKIFGELITLLEEDKRIGTTNHVTVNLPYTKEHFALPSNLYIIGTMNTSDKSIAQIDIALRRRFNFVEMMPSYDDLGEIDGIELDKLLETMNKRIEFLLDRDHLIGHAYLARVNNMAELQEAMKNKIIPLLQEYFYGDNEKVGMILGGIGSKSSNEYIVYKEVIKGTDLFKGFSNIDDLGSKETFVVNEDITSDRIRKIYE